MVRDPSLAHPDCRLRAHFGAEPEAGAADWSSAAAAGTAGADGCAAAACGCAAAAGGWLADACGCAALRA
jgi:hypothetical protein